MLKPLGDRVLIKPHENPNETESGLVLPENRSDKYVEMQGTVIAVGTPKHPRKEEGDLYADVITDMSRLRGTRLSKLERETLVGTADLLRDLVRREPCVQPGDDVIFSWQAGQEITVNDETFLLLRESDLLAILEPDPA